MSLINDALKRANQAQRKAPVAGPLGVPLQTTAPARKPTLAPVLVTIAALALAIALGGGLIVLGLRLFKPLPSPEAVQEPEPTKQLVSAPAPPVTSPKSIDATPTANQSKSVVIPPPEIKPVKTQPKPTPPLASPPATTKTEIQPTQPAPLKTVGKGAETPASPPAVAVTPIPPPVPATVPAPTPTPVTPAPLPLPRKVEFPDLKLIGIFYNPSNPSAMVNGRKLNVGGTIFGAKVTAIERDSVTVEFEGEKKVLYLQ